MVSVYVEQKIEKNTHYTLKIPKADVLGTQSMNLISLLIIQYNGLVKKNFMIFKD